MESAIAFAVCILKSAFSISERYNEITYTHSTVKYRSKETKGVIYLKEQ